MRHLLARLPGELDAWEAGARLVDLAPLPAGESSLTFVGELTGSSHERVVFKVAVPGIPPVRNRDVLRQASIFRAFASSEAGVPVPTVLFESRGDPPEVPPLFAMSFAAGEDFEPNIDEREVLPDAPLIRSRALTAARTLADLHRTPLPEALEPIAPVVPLCDEVERWRAALEKVDPALSGGHERVANRLIDALPAPSPSAVIHGDYRLGNMLFDGEDLVAIIDWEIWGRGDPRVDLGWFLLTAEPDLHPTAIRSCPGMPRAAELLACYEDAARATVADADWFHSFTVYKFAAIVGLIIRHRRKVGGDDEFTERVAPRIPTMLDAALGACP